MDSRFFVLWFIGLLINGGLSFGVMEEAEFDLSIIFFKDFDEGNCEEFYVWIGLFEFIHSHKFCRTVMENL